MTIIKQLNYEVQDSQGSAIPDSSRPISIRINSSTPKYLIHKAVVIQSRNNRQGTASCKTRSEVRGGGKKPWKQKVTGQARSGSSNSPLWKEGGVTFGPKPRSYYKKLNIKERRLALRTAVYYSLHKITVLDNTFNEVQEPKTKKFASLLNKFIPLNSGVKALIVAHSNNANLALSVRNIPNVQLLYFNTLNVKDLLAAKHVIMTEEALTHITQTI